MRPLFLFLALPLLLAVSSSALAAPPELTRHDSLTTVVQSIPAGKTIRLQMLDPGERRFEGAFERFAADTLYLKDRAAGPQALPVDSLRTLSVGGNAAGRTALILGVVAFFGTLITLSAMESSFESGFGFGGSSSDDNDELPISIAAGFAGALVGYGIGSTIDTWDQRYPKK